MVQSIPGALVSMYGNPAYFNHTVYYCGVGNRLAAFPISNAQMSSSPASVSAATFRYPCVVPTISANGTSNAIVWALDPGAGLRAWDALDLSGNCGTRASIRTAIEREPRSSTQYRRWRTEKYMPARRTRLRCTGCCHRPGVQRFRALPAGTWAQSLRAP